MNLLNHCYYFYKSDSRSIPKCLLFKGGLVFFLFIRSLQVESRYEEIVTQMRYSICQEPVSIRDPDPEKLYSLKCIRVKLQKVIMRFLQVGPLSKFSWMAALPGGAMLAHTEVCAHDTHGWKEPDRVSRELGSVLSPHP